MKKPNSNTLFYQSYNRENNTIDQDSCNASGLPWFHKVLTCTSSTTEALEMRICANSDTNDEDIAIGSCEIFVK